jgi:hypothetical protein
MEDKLPPARCRLDGVSGLMRGADTSEGGTVSDGIVHQSATPASAKKISVGGGSVAQESRVAASLKELPLLRSVYRCSGAFRCSRHPSIIR